MRKNTPNEMQFQEGLKALFEQYDGMVGFEHMVDVTIGFLASNTLRRIPHMTAKAFGVVCQKTFRDVGNQLRS